MVAALKRQSGSGGEKPDGGSDGETPEGGSGGEKPDGGSGGAETELPCGNGTVEGAEQCDDGNDQGGDGCASCAVEDGWACTGSPSTCETKCGDGIIVGTEECDDENDIESDGCTQCVDDTKCGVAADTLYDAETNRCYAKLTPVVRWAEAQVLCERYQGTFAAPSTTGELAFLNSVQWSATKAYLGGTDSAAEGTWGWTNAEPWAFPAGNAAWKAGEPRHSQGEDCLVLNADGTLSEAACYDRLASLCEFEGRTAFKRTCGDGWHDVGEECDAGKATSVDCNDKCQWVVCGQSACEVPTVRSIFEFRGFPDSGYNGPLASMECVTLHVEAGPTVPETLQKMRVGLYMTHGRIGDVVLKLVSPQETVITLMNLPGLDEQTDSGGATAGNYGLCSAQT